MTRRQVQRHALPSRMGARSRSDRSAGRTPHGRAIVRMTLRRSRALEKDKQDGAIMTAATPALMSETTCRTCRTLGSSVRSNWAPKTVSHSLAEKPAQRAARATRPVPEKRSSKGRPFTSRECRTAAAETEEGVARAETPRAVLRNAPEATGGAPAAGLLHHCQLPPHLKPAEADTRVSGVAKDEP